MKLDSLDKLLLDQLKDLYSAESQIIRALPRMAKAAASDSLRQAFQTHLEETKIQKARLETIAGQLDIKLAGKKCAAMEGLVEEGKEVLEIDGAEPIIDAALIAAAQRVEHYEISAYGTARTIAQHLGYEDAVRLLDETLQEEGDTDHKLTDLAESEIYPAITDFLAREEADAATGGANGKSRSRARSS